MPQFEISNFSNTPHYGYDGLNLSCRQPLQHIENDIKSSGGARKKSWGGPLKLVIEKLFKASQNRSIIELFKFFGWATTSLCGNLDQPKPKTDIKLYKIS